MLLRPPGGQALPCVGVSSFKNNILPSKNSQYSGLENRFETNQIKLKAHSLRGREAMSVLVEYVFQIATVILAAAALVSAERAIRISRYALQSTKEASLVSLRVMVREAIADAESSFLRLQGDCQTAQGQWEAYERKHFPPMRSNFFDRPEVEKVKKIEHQGRLLLRELLNETSVSEVDDEPTLERFIGTARTKSVDIERLRLQVEAPRPFPH